MAEKSDTSVADQKPAGTLDVTSMSVAELQAGRPDLVILDAHPTQEVREAFQEGMVGKLEGDGLKDKAISLLAGEDEITDRLELAKRRLYDLDLPDKQHQAVEEILAATARRFSVDLPQIGNGTAESKDDSNGKGSEKKDDPEKVKLQKTVHELEGKDAATEAVSGIDGPAAFKDVIFKKVMERVKAGTLSGREAVKEAVEATTIEMRRGAEALHAPSPYTGLGETIPETGDKKPHKAAGLFFPQPPAKETEK